VLSSSDSYNAMLKCFHYLSQHSNCPVFSRRDNDKTGTLGKAFSERYLMDELKMERENASKRRDLHWEAVRRKQDEILRMKAELVKMQAELLSLENKLTRLDSRSQINKVNELIYSENVRIAKKQNEIERAEKSPPPVIVETLPRDDSEAKKVLFFLKMPVVFRVLAQVSFMAQNVLLPRSSQYGVDSMIEWDENTSKMIRSNLDDHHKLKMEEGITISTILLLLS